MNKFMVDWATNLNKQLNISFVPFVLFLYNYSLWKNPATSKNKNKKIFEVNFFPTLKIDRINLITLAKW